MALDEFTGRSHLLRVSFGEFVIQSRAQLSFGQRIAAAIEMGGIVFAEFLQNAAVWLVSAVPFAAVVAAVWGVWHIIRRKKSRK